MATSYLNRHFLGVENFEGQVPPPFPMALSALDHDQVLTWTSLPQTPPHFDFLLGTEPQLFLIWLQLFRICMLINEFEWSKSRECYERTNLIYHWRIPLLIVLTNGWCNLQFGRWVVEFEYPKTNLNFWYVTAIAFRTKLIARNVKLIGESLKLTGKSYIKLSKCLKSIWDHYLVNCSYVFMYLLYLYLFLQVHSFTLLCLSPLSEKNKKGKHDNLLWRCLKKVTCSISFRCSIFLAIFSGFIKQGSRM